MTSNNIFWLLTLGILVWGVVLMAREKRQALRRRLLDVEVDLALIKQFLLKSSTLAPDRESFTKEWPKERERLYREPFFPKEKEHFIDSVQFHEWATGDEKFPPNKTWMAEQDKEFGIKEEYTWAFRIKKTKLELQTLFDRYPTKVFDQPPDYSIPTPADYIGWLDFTESPSAYLEWSLALIEDRIKRGVETPIPPEVHAWMRDPSKPAPPALAEWEKNRRRYDPNKDAPELETIRKLWQSGRRSSSPQA